MRPYANTAIVSRFVFPQSVRVVRFQKTAFENDRRTIRTEATNTKTRRRIGIQKNKINSTEQYKRIGPLKVERGKILAGQVE